MIKILTTEDYIFTYIYCFTEDIRFLLLNQYQLMLRNVQ